MAELRAEATGEYEPWHRRFMKRMSQFEQKAPGPDLVADAVSQAVRSRRPALRYLVTCQAHLFTQMRNWFPERMFETGLRSAFHLDDQRF